MKTEQRIVEHEFQGYRLDQYVKTLYDQFSRSAIQDKIKKGEIRLNGNVVKTGYLIKAGDQIEIDFLNPVLSHLEPIDLKLDIVYEDDDIALINKPEGMVVHPASSFKDPTLVHGLLHQLSHLSSINGTIRPGIVHRIDKDTSGLLLIAKNDLAHKKLSEDLKEHKIERIYYALVYGQFKERNGFIDAPIGRDTKNRLKMSVIATGKHAKTHFKVIETFDKMTLIECQLETGRTHQIRVHMDYIGHPVVGDPIYGHAKKIEKTGQFLHAKTIKFTHPTKKEKMTFDVDLPLSFTNKLNEIKHSSHD
jgi:23S rRNA pseudouridine1911/1915/1917 synthase